MIRPIRTGEHAEVLRTPASPVTVFDEALAGLAADLRETMRSADGVGLAAPQVEVPVRMVVIEFIAEDPRETVPHRVLVNPEVIWRSDRKTVFEEACLSLPGVFGDVKRPAAVLVRYQDLGGTGLERRAEGLEARILQHEIDHLDGKLFTDYVPPAKRGLREAPDYPRL